MQVKCAAIGCAKVSHTQLAIFPPNFCCNSSVLLVVAQYVNICLLISIYDDAYTVSKQMKVASEGHMR
jgi:hypothetical protein